MNLKKNILYIETIEGKVKRGKQIGESLGFPTANIDYKHSIKLSDGVYIATVDILDLEIFDLPAIVNKGKHPTFPEGPPTIEAYIISKMCNIYGMTARISFAEKIRDEKQFASKEELIMQIKKDVECTKQWYSKHII